MSFSALRAMNIGYHPSHVICGREKKQRGQKYIFPENQLAFRCLKSKLAEKQ